MAEGRDETVAGIKLRRDVDRLAVREQRFDIVAFGHQFGRQAARRDQPAQQAERPIARVIEQPEFFDRADARYGMRTRLESQPPFEPRRRCQVDRQPTLAEWRQQFKDAVVRQGGRHRPEC